METEPFEYEVDYDVCDNWNYIDPEILRLWAKIRKCRKIENGGRIVYCPTCNNHRVLYHPCNKRGCMKCGPKNQQQWREKHNKKILPIGHYHLVFSVPEIFVYIWLKMKNDLINVFFHLVKESFKEYQKKTGITYGLTMVFQSNGRGLCYKPHMHCLLTPGGTDKNGKWVDDHSIRYTELLEGIKRNIKGCLRKKIRKIEEDALNGMLSLQKEKEWTYYATYHKKTGEQIVNYLSRSACGLVFDVEKEITMDDKTRRITVAQNHLGKEEKTELEFSDFRERYFNHIPPKGSVVVRNYGLYSNRHKEELEKIRKGILLEKYEEYEKNAEDEFIEECPECHTPLEVQQIFSYEELPRIIKEYNTRFRAPPENNAVLD